jgi:hypothetical protein
MKLDKNTILLLFLLIGIGWFMINRVSHVTRSIPVDDGWSPPVSVASTENGVAGGGGLYKWHDTLILVQSRYDWSSKSSTCSIIVRNNEPSNSWTQLPISGVPGDCAFYSPALDQANDRIMFERGYIESNRLQMGAIFLRLTVNNRIQVEAERTWTMDQESLLGRTSTNVTLNEPAARTDRPNRDYPSLGVGILEGSKAYVAFSINAHTLFKTPVNYGGKTYMTGGVSDGPFYNGVFHSTDLGKTWQMEKISDLDAGEPEMCRTKDYYYNFGMTGGGIRFSLKSVDGGSWSEPKFLTRTFTNRRGGGAVAESDTVHVCWLDNRHEIKYWLSLARSGRGNYEVAYCRRKDSDASWRKDIILSRGVMFAYSPSMSVEGDKIVLAWAGAQTAHAWPFEGDPSDIYYVTSKDGGKTWNKPLQVTDHFKDGITSGSARVALQNGVIHLFYAQGRYDRQAQVSQQGGWPVYYQQRAFPD